MEYRMPIDPRTGRIMSKRGQSVKPAPSINVKQLASSLLELLPLEELARMVGKVIAEEIKKGQVQPLLTDVVHDLRRYPVMDVPTYGTPPPRISEEIIDVGIGEQEELKRGDGSTTLGSEETKQDTSLSDSKSKLKKLKSQ